ncbi:hypothetical protein EVAR_36482_1 [Eumeta japonica]|uniref:Uncharacterized protein n=1 Tax=Eumeta variegata TaxID=151549 RepID=A0A4C1WRZ5_EUMVA|nr:hypothetical protein EVAR_36482_1 [Eumeta japonica]
MPAFARTLDRVDHRMRAAAVFQASTPNCARAAGPPRRPPAYADFVTARSFVTLHRDEQQLIIIRDTAAQRYVSYQDAQSVMRFAQPKSGRNLHSSYRGDIAAALKPYSETYPVSQQPGSPQAMLRDEYRLRNDLP